MPETTRRAQVDRYLEELDTALAGRPEAERADIIEGVREHIETVVGDDATSDEIDGVLQALGDPLTIAAEAGGDTGAEPGEAGTRLRGRLSSPWVPAAVIALIVISTPALIFQLPILTLLAGLALLWFSPLWTPGEKLLGTFLLPAPGVALLVLGLFSWGVTSCVETMTNDHTGQVILEQETCVGGPSVWAGIVGTGALAAAVVAGVVTAVVLYRRGARRAQP